MKKLLLITILLTMMPVSLHAVDITSFNEEQTEFVLDLARRLKQAKIENIQLNNELEAVYEELQGSIILNHAYYNEILSLREIVRDYYADNIRLQHRDRFSFGDFYFSGGIGIGTTFQIQLQPRFYFNNNLFLYSNMEGSWGQYGNWSELPTPVFNGTIGLGYSVGTIIRR